MGMLLHHAIIVTDWRKSDIDAAREIAAGIFPKGLVTPVFEGCTNELYTFFVVPDGSKEGWPDSDDRDYERSSFLDRLFDSGLSVDYVEVQFGGDYGSELTSIIRSHDSDLDSVENLYP